MKLTPLLLVLAAVFLIGCVSGPFVSDMETGKEKSVTEESVSEEVKKEPVKIVTTIFYPVKVESYFGDGVKDEYSVFTYSDGGIHLLKEELFNPDDSLVQYIEFEYSGTESSKRNTFDAAGNLLSFETIIMDMQGNIIKKEKFNNKDILQSISEYEYTNGKKTSWKVF